MVKRLDESLSGETLRKGITGKMSSTIDPDKIVVTDSGAIQLLNKNCKCNKWISVEERLPENEQIVLTYVPTYYCGVQQSLYSKWGHSKYNGWWTSGVTHWMPLPEPPKNNHTSTPEEMEKCKDDIEKHVNMLKKCGF